MNMIRTKLTKFVAGLTALMLFATNSISILPSAYAADDTAKMGTVNLSTNHPDGAYTIYPLIGFVPVGIGTGVSNDSFDLPASDGLGTGYRIEFKDISGFTTPSTIYFNLSTGSTLTYVGEYKNAGGSTTPEAKQGTVNVSTNNPDGTYTINKLDGTFMGSGSGVSVDSFDLPATDGLGTGYMVTFGAVTGFNTPATQSFNLSTNNSVTITGTYTNSNQTPVNQAKQGTVNVSTNHPDGTYTINKLDGTFMGSGSGVSVDSFDMPATDGLGTGYMITFGSVSGYVTPSVIYFNLSTNATLDFSGLYQPQGAGSSQKQGTVNVSTNHPDGTYTINKLDGTLMGSGSGVSVDSFDMPASDGLGTGYAITFGNVSGYITPAVIYFNLSTNADLTFTGLYSPNGSGPNQKQGTVNVSTNLIEGTYRISKLDGTFMGSGSGVSVDSFDMPASDGLGTGYAIVFGNVDTYTTPAVIYFNLSTGANLTFTGTYTQGPVVNSTVIVNQIGGNGTVVLSGPSGATINTAVYSDNAAAAGAYSLSSITAPTGVTLNRVTDGTGATITAPYSQNLTAGGTVTYNVYYNTNAGSVTFTKTASSQAMENNNQRVTYTITATRNDSSSPSPINVTISDSMVGGALSNNGGTLSYVSGSYTCTGAVCDNHGNADGILTAPVTVTLDQAGSSAVITYQMVSNNSAQTSAATFTNTATASFVDPETNSQASLTSSATVSVSAPASGGGSGGGGGSGTFYYYTDDLKLNVTKLVSLDGSNYVDASTKANGLVIPDNTTSTLYFKVSIKNPNTVSVRNVEFDPSFDAGSSGIVAGRIDRLNGEGVTKDIFGKIVIGDIYVDQTVTFTYQRLITAKDKNQNPAVEQLKLENYMAAMNYSQNGLKKVSKGLYYPTYLYTEKPAGPTVTNAGDILSIKVSTDKSGAKVGEEVQYTITIKNVSGGDLTGIMLNHTLPAELMVTDAGIGLVKGSDIQWKTTILRDGEQKVYKFTAKVASGTPGTIVKSLTRALVNEYDGIAPVTSYLTILGGNVVLAQTGSAGILLLLAFSVIAYLGIMTIKRRATGIR